MKEIFMAEREANRGEDKHLDSEYHYAKWKKEGEEEEIFHTLFNPLTQNKDEQNKNNRAIKGPNTGLNYDVDVKD